MEIYNVRPCSHQFNFKAYYYRTCKFQNFVSLLQVFHFGYAYKMSLFEYVLYVHKDVPWWIILGWNHCCIVYNFFFSLSLSYPMKCKIFGHIFSCLFCILHIKLILSINVINLSPHPWPHHLLSIC